MKVLFLIEGWISPAPRYRVLQYLAFLEANGVTCEVRALHGRSYPFFYHWRGVGALYKALVRAARRWYHQRDAARYDVVFQQRLSLPFSAFLERRLARRNPRLIFDYDDALFQTEAGPHAGRLRTFREVVAVSRRIIAGTAYLAGFADKPAAVIPTVIDTDRYLPRPSPRRPDAPVVIGWMGTQSNYPNFAPLVAVLARVLAAFPAARLHVVSDAPPPFSLPQTTFTRWAADTEVSLLQGFDIGIMPLADNSWNRGKCAFKLIQYMSVGIPVVAGDVGANAEVVVPDENGYLARNGDDWEQALRRLLEDGELRARMGARGRDRCVAQYSVRAAQAQLLTVLRDTASDQG